MFNWPKWQATCNGVYPAFVCALTSARLLRRTRAASTLSSWAHRWSGVRALFALALTLLPFSMSKPDMSVWPKLICQWMSKWYFVSIDLIVCSHSDPPFRFRCSFYSLFCEDEENDRLGSPDCWQIQTCQICRFVGARQIPASLPSSYQICNRIADQKGSIEEDRTKGWFLECPFIQVSCLVWRWNQVAHINSNRSGMVKSTTRCLMNGFSVVGLTLPIDKLDKCLQDFLNILDEVTV